MAKLRGDPEKSTRLHNDLAGYLMVLFLFMELFTYAVGPELMGIVFRGEYSGAAPVLRMLSRMTRRWRSRPNRRRNRVP